MSYHHCYLKGKELTIHPQITCKLRGFYTTQRSLSVDHVALWNSCCETLSGPPCRLYILLYFKTSLKHPQNWPFTIHIVKQTINYLRINVGSTPVPPHQYFKSHDYPSKNMECLKHITHFEVTKNIYIWRALKHIYSL